MAKKNYYKILGVSRTASPEEISAAKNRLAKKYHPDAVYQQGVVGACIAVGQQIVRIGKVHIMTYCMIDGFAAVVQVEGVLIGVCVAAGTERAGTEAEADIMLIVFQVVVGYHFAGVFEPYGFGGIRW